MEGAFQLPRQKENEIKSAGNSNDRKMITFYLLVCVLILLKVGQMENGFLVNQFQTLVYRVV